MPINTKETYYPRNQQEWREWLETNHSSKSSVWLIFYKKETQQPTIDWSEAVDEALCFGWIDSLKKKIDDERYMQLFSKRKPNSTWSKINKDKVKVLIDEGRMTQAGLRTVVIARENGMWSFLDDVEKLIIPDDLEIAFNKSNGSKEFFLSLTKSIRKGMLAWIVMAKREETRKKRISELVSAASKGEKPKPFM
ncbi:hypothetical protein EYV94_13190 [Puteibacter caeruleilacunae]|nr:hypothetical protein EYV94_13190 [Puteibacter caeruleilacunae]